MILKNSETDEIIEETEIPYYMSDAQTNKLRAGLIFPFLSFNNCNDKTPNKLFNYPNTMCSSRQLNNLKFLVLFLLLTPYSILAYAYPTQARLLFCL